MSESKLVKTIVAGAIVGAIISMFDRKTREHTIETSKRVKDTVVYYSKNRQELQEVIEQKVEAAQKIYENASTNINTIVSKMDDVKEIPESVQSIVTDTKDILNNRERLN